MMGIEPEHECDNCSLCLSEGCKCCSQCRTIKFEKERKREIEVDDHGMKR